MIDNGKKQILQFGITFYSFQLIHKKMGVSMDSEHFHAFCRALQKSTEKPALAQIPDCNGCLIVDEVTKLLAYGGLILTHCYTEGGLDGLAVGPGARARGPGRVRVCPGEGASNPRPKR